MKNRAYFTDVMQRKRYICALILILGMVGVAEGLGEREIIFPEMVALTIGMWIVNKRVWYVDRFRVVLLMVVGAFAGVCIVRYSTMPLLLELLSAFVIAAVCLVLSRTTLIPLISACMLPVLLRTESWVYPVAVFFMTFIVVLGQWFMEKKELRNKIEYTSLERQWKNDLLKWTFLGLSLSVVILLSIYTSFTYLILPPLIVTYVEFANSKAGFRNRPTQVLLVLFTAALLGTVFQLVGYFYLHLPEFVVAFLSIVCLFCIFEFLGKFFAPAGAIVLIPMLLPEENLIWLPLQVLMGGILFIGIAMICFQKCLRWSKAQMIVCLIPSFMRNKGKHSIKINRDS